MRRRNRKAGGKSSGPRFVRSEIITGAMPPTDERMSHADDGALIKPETTKTRRQDGYTIRTRVDVLYAEREIDEREREWATRFVNDWLTAQGHDTRKDVTTRVDGGADAKGYEDIRLEAALRRNRICKVLGNYALLLEWALVNEWTWAAIGRRLTFRLHHAGKLSDEKQVSARDAKEWTIAAIKALADSQDPRGACAVTRARIRGTQFV